MLNRWKKLVREAERQLVRAEAARAACRPVWAWFAAHQSAEFAVKALRLRYSLNGHERMVTRLLLDLPATVPVPESLLEKAHVFDSHYLPIRLADTEPLDQPRANGIATDHAVDTAREILAFVHAELLAERTAPPESRSA
ncbi:MAG: HEPN domain-containing protein [Longimicrobiales bacterium]